MFKFATITLLALALNGASARPQDATTPVSVVSIAQNVDEKGFSYAFELSNGIKEEASGTSKTVKVPKIDPQTNEPAGGDEDSEVIVQQGKYSYTAPDGQLIEVTYIADENGFQPQGAHLPSLSGAPAADAASAPAATA